MWICEFCEKHNQDKNKKCRRAFCKGEMSLQQVKVLEAKIITVRDYCPKCMAHQDFVQTGKKRFKCPRCRRSFKFRGKPVPEVEKELVNDTHIKEIKIVT